jgi:hypothetical protein
VEFPSKSMQSKCRARSTRSSFDKNSASQIDARYENFVMVYSTKNVRIGNSLTRLQKIFMPDKQFPNGFQFRHDPFISALLRAPVIPLYSINQLRRIKLSLLRKILDTRGNRKHTQILTRHDNFLALKIREKRQGRMRRHTSESSV